MFFTRARVASLALLTTFGLLPLVPASADSTANGALTAVEASRESLSARLGPGQPAPIVNAGDSRPNIVLISADDMRADELRFMPRTRAALGQAGMTFNQALTPHPLCCPARAELLTGQYAQNNGVRTNWGPQGGYGPLDATQTIATWLSSSGYNTAMVGKHLNSVQFKDGPEPGWTYFDPTLNGYSDYYNFEQYANGAYNEVDGVYYTDYVRDRSLEALDALSSYDAPFYMWISHFGPHSAQDRSADRGERKGPPVAPPGFYDEPGVKERVRNEARDYFREMSKKDSWFEEDKSDKQAYVAKEHADPRKVFKLMKGRIAALDSVDRAVETVVNRLAETGELDNTYVAFITDNGYMLGEHNYIGKVLGFEEAFRTPLLVRGPGVAAGATHGKPVTIVDLVPTWLDLAEAEATLPLDGLSLAPILRGEQADLHPAGVLVQAGPVEHETAPRGWYFRGVRTERYTYLSYYDGWVELYDRSTDPDQANSVAGNPAYADVQRELASRTEKLASCSGPEACNPVLGPLPKPVRKR